MKILVRLPNWLGDMVMSVGFINQIKKIEPTAEISVIAKKGIHTILPFFPPLAQEYIFSKDEFPGVKGAFNFGKHIAKQISYDVFYCLPDSFSSALMAFGTGAKRKVGYRKDFRRLLLTNSYKKTHDLHRVEQYTALLDFYYKRKMERPSVSLAIGHTPADYIVININSEASSRRLPKSKAVSIIDSVRENTNEKIMLIGSGAEKNFVDDVLSALKNTSGVYNVAGKTSLPQLVELISSAKVLLTTDSGPAHLSNAIGVPTIVLFGAGNEQNTAPYNDTKKTIIRLGQLSCEPCKKNVCVRFGVPQCLTLLDEKNIIQQVLKYIQM